MQALPLEIRDHIARFLAPSDVLSLAVGANVSAFCLASARRLRREVDKNEHKERLSSILRIFTMLEIGFYDPSTLSRGENLYIKYVMA